MNHHCQKEQALVLKFKMVIAGILFRAAQETRWMAKLKLFQQSIIRGQDLAMTYFKIAGKENVDKTLGLVKRMAEELGMQNVIVASTTGFTAEKAYDVFKNMDVTLTIVGTERNRFSRDLQRMLEEKGHHVRFSREVSYEYPELVKLAFRRFSQGVKVAVEIAMIAAQEGFASTGEDIICVGKWDTALIIKPAKSDNFSELKVREIICMPR